MSTAANDPATVNAVMKMIVKAVMDNEVADVELALEKGLNIDQIRGPNGLTLLHIAAVSGSADVTRVLLASGMDPLAPNNDGVTPLDMARHAGHPNIATMIENAIRNASEDHIEEVFERITLQAIVSNDASNIRQALDAGLRDELFDWRGPNGETYLHLAAHSGSLEVVKLLVAAGFDPGVTMNDGVTPIDIASVKGHDTMAKLLMQAKHAAKASQAPAQETVQTATQLIVQAVLGNDVANIRMALDKGLNIQGIHGPNRMTLLHLAAEQGHDDMAKLLIEAGLDPLDETDDGLSAPVVAVMAGHAALGKFLLEEGKKLAERNARALNERAASLRKAQEQAPAPAAPTQAPASQSGEPRALDLSERHLWGTPVDDLYGYWKPGQSRTMARLRKTFGGAKAEPESNAPAAQSPQPAAGTVILTPQQDAFKRAILANDAAAIRTQVEQGFPIDDRVYSGSTALHVAAANGKTDAVEALLDLGADVNTQDAQGNTAMLYAIGHKHPDTAIFLAETARVHVDHQAPSGYTALHTAVQAPLHVVIPYLLAKNPNLNITNNDGQTPYALAQALGRHKIALTLDVAYTRQQEYGSPIREVDPDQERRFLLLQKACIDQDVDLVKAILHRADDPILDIEAVNGAAAIHYGVLSNHPAIIAHLLSLNDQGHGLEEHALLTLRDREADDGGPYTPLDLARLLDHDHAIRLLEAECDRLGLYGENYIVMDRDRPEDMRVVNEYTGTPVHRAMAGKIIQGILNDSAADDEDANEDLKDVDHEVARFKRLADACIEGDVVRVLANVTGIHDPIVKMTGPDGMSLLHFAVVSDNRDVLEVLVEHGVDLQAQTTKDLGDRAEAGPKTALDLARILRKTNAVAVLEEACDAAKGIDGETPMVKAMRKPDGGLFVGVYNKFTGEKVHRTMAERVAAEVLEQHGEKPTPNAPVPKDLDAFLSGVRDALRGNR
ncbi:ankyrin repeat domain-containing protein [Burkholderia gladioli]|uniref:ankyrin repeat domain-containing protein n=1 Tax=Burkholderia gladioli TaxID=28095 RepID=UPI00163FD905|nr:ankyrin repeat domain-containing protein [Burkholderia gladioli]